jgi:glucose-specific phosphotransferase system IIA component
MGFFSNIFGKKKTNVVSEKKVISVSTPVDGKVVSTSEVKDPTFSQNMMGKGFAMIPTNGEFVSPINGQITLIADTGHAFSVKDENGVEILVHIGIDTVGINSSREPGTPLKTFTIHAKSGDRVSVGDKIITANLDEIKAKRLDTITPVIIINNDFVASKNISEPLVIGETVRSTKIIEIS